MKILLSTLIWWCQYQRRLATKLATFILSDKWLALFYWHTIKSKYDFACQIVQTGCFRDFDFPGDLFGECVAYERAKPGKEENLIWARITRSIKLLKHQLNQ